MKTVNKRIRHAFRCDIKELCQISGKEHDYFANFLTHGKILMCNKGYLMFEQSGNLCRIHDIFTNLRRQKIGTQLINKLQKEMEELGVMVMEVTIPETDLETSLFLKSVDFKAVLSENYYVFKKVI